MSQELRFFTDEDIYGAVAAALRKSGVDAVSTPEAVRLAETDESQLEWAATEGRVFVTFNVAHFATLHAAWQQQGRHHAGIVVSNQRPLGDLLRRLQRLRPRWTAMPCKTALSFLAIGKATLLIRLWQSLRTRDRGQYCPSKRHSITIQATCESERRSSENRDLQHGKSVSSIQLKCPEGCFGT